MNHPLPVRAPTLQRLDLQRLGLQRGARMLACLVLLAILSIAFAPAASAHPLGNFTTNTSSAILPAEGTTTIVFVLDLAEIPTQQTRSAIEADGGPDSWAEGECARIADSQQLTVNGQVRTPEPGGVSIEFPEGQAGLETLRLTCVLTAQTNDLPNPSTLTYVNSYTAERIGWREIVVAPNDSTILSSDVPDTSPTDVLRQYPADAQIMRATEATATFNPNEGPPAPAELTVGDLGSDAARPGGLEGLVDRYTELISRQELTVGFILLAIVLAIALGTAHAVAPGHGKTVIAAYLLGEGGQTSQAVALGGTVAITHTIGVLILGLIVQTSTTLAPESLYPILGVMGGVIFTGLGILLLYRAITNRGHSHDHEHDHGHGLDGHGHDEHGHDEHGHGHQSVDDDHDDHGHGHGHLVEVPTQPQTTWRMLILPGLAGGMVPSPSALLVLLGGVALGRTWFGVILVLAYGVGMALALVGAGYLLHKVRFRVMDRLESDTWARVSTGLPILTSSLIIVGGLVIVGRSLVL